MTQNLVGLGDGSKKVKRVSKSCNSGIQKKIINNENYFYEKYTLFLYLKNEKYTLFLYLGTNNKIYKGFVNLVFILNKNKLEYKQKYCNLITMWNVVRK